MSSVFKNCPWPVLLGGLKLRLQPWDSTTSSARKEPLGELCHVVEIWEQ